MYGFQGTNDAIGLKLETYVHATGRLDDARVEAARGRLTRLGAIALNDAVGVGVEMEFEDVALVGFDVVGGEGQAALGDVDGDDLGESAGGEGGGDSGGSEVHFKCWIQFCEMCQICEIVCDV